MQDNRYTVNVHETNGNTYSNVVSDEFALFSLINSDTVEKVEVVYHTKNNYFKDKVFILTKK